MPRPGNQSSNTPPRSRKGFGAVSFPGPYSAR